MGKKDNLIYLDSNSTTILSKDTTTIFVDMVMNGMFGNPSSSHLYGSKMRLIVDAARHSVASSLGCSASEIIFTSGGTEANNLALRGLYSEFSPPPNKIVSTEAEHSSVFYTIENLSAPEKIKYIPLNRDGSLDVSYLDHFLTEDVFMVSVMLANNETGVIFPVKEIAKKAHEKGILVHCDAVQAYGKIPIDVKDLDVDLLSISGHKVHALPGVGALYARRGLLLHPQITGGSQEGSLRAGTENYVGIASLGGSATDIRNTKGKLFSSELRDVFEVGLKNRLGNIIINGERAARVPNTSSITFKGIHSASMLTALEERNVLASAGSACSSGAMRPSRTLMAMGMDSEDAMSTVRFSFSKYSTIRDVGLAIKACVECVDLLGKNSLIPTID